MSHRALGVQFLPAREILSGYAPKREDYRFKDGKPESEKNLWARKTQEAHERGLTDSIRKDGIKEPVELSTQSMGSGPHGEENRPSFLEGHHRVAAAYHIDPDHPVPVKFRDTKQERAAVKARGPAKVKPPVMLDEL